MAGRRRTNTKAENALDQTLGKIEEGLMLRDKMGAKLRQAREGHLPSRPDPEKYTTEEIAAWQDRADLIAGLQAEIQKYDDYVKQGWDFAAGLTDPEGRLAGSQDELQRQLAALRRRQTELQAKRGTFREDAHEQLDMILSEHTSRIESMLSFEVGAFEVEQLAEIWAYADHGFQQRLHDSIDARPADAFPAGSRSSWQSEVDMLARQIRHREAELQARESEKQIAEAQEAHEQVLASFEAG